MAKWRGNGALARQAWQHGESGVKWRNGGIEMAWQYP